MELTSKDAGFHAGILLHELFRLGDSRIENAKAIYVTAVSDGADDRQDSFSAKLKVSATVFPDNFVSFRLIPFRPVVQYHDAILARLREPLFHELIGNY